MDFGDFGSYDPSWFSGIEYNTPFWDSSAGLGTGLPTTGLDDFMNNYPVDPGYYSYIAGDIYSPFYGGGIPEGYESYSGSPAPTSPSGGGGGILDALGGLAKNLLPLAPMLSSLFKGSTPDKTSTTTSKGGLWGLDTAKEGVSRLKENWYQPSERAAAQGWEISDYLTNAAKGLTPQQQATANQLARLTQWSPYKPLNQEALIKQYYDQLVEDVNRDTQLGFQGIPQGIVADSIAGLKSKELEAILQSQVEEAKRKQAYDEMQKSMLLTVPQLQSKALEDAITAGLAWKRTGGPAIEEDQASLMLKYIAEMIGAGKNVPSGIETRTGETPAPSTGGALASALSTMTPEAWEAILPTLGGTYGLLSQLLTGLV